MENNSTTGPALNGTVKIPKKRGRKPKNHQWEQQQQQQQLQRLQYFKLLKIENENNTNGDGNTVSTNNGDFQQDDRADLIEFDHFGNTGEDNSLGSKQNGAAHTSSNNGNLREFLIPIRLELEVDGEMIVDNFAWDMNGE